jgi:CRP-like cAMP-binding protein
VAAQVLHDHAHALPVLRRLLSNALQVLMAQVAQTAACNSQHSLVQRLARWLLMAYDRIDGDELTMTQEFLSIMLVVRRAGVTVASQALVETGAIRARRGRIIVCDRAALEAAACGCYGRVRAFTEAVAARNL